MFEKIVWSVIDIVHYYAAVSWTQPTTVSGVIDTADHKTLDFKVEYLGESMFKKAVTRGSVSQEELLDEKNQRVPVKTFS
jgi:hypothetical protein